MYQYKEKYTIDFREVKTYFNTMDTIDKANYGKEIIFGKILLKDKKILQNIKKQPVKNIKYNLYFFTKCFLTSWYTCSLYKVAFSNLISLIKLPLINKIIQHK